jgi:DNA polymerase elongation subunit (family B)
MKQVLIHAICSANTGFDLFDDERDDDKRLNASVTDASDFIVDIREWDVPYHVRVMIDLGKFWKTENFLISTNSFRYTDRKMVYG